jgi:cell division protein FtsB
MADVEFTEPKRPAKRKTGPKVNYVKSVKKKRKSAKKKFEWSWTKAGWMMCGALVLRLVFMEGGVIDFNSMENTLIKKEHHLQNLRKENAELIQEIHKLRTSPQYQRKITREHLGVIAKDEYLVLFSRDSRNSI